MKNIFVPFTRHLPATLTEIETMSGGQYRVVLFALSSDQVPAGYFTVRVSSLGAVDPADLATAGEPADVVLGGPAPLSWVLAQLAVQYGLEPLNVQFDGAVRLVRLPGRASKGAGNAAVGS